jgi:hypothetical protein
MSTTLKLTLTKNTKYDVDALTCVGWTGDSDLGHEGYNFFDYFEEDGAYKGADDFGIEPVVEITHDQVAAARAALAATAAYDAYYVARDARIAASAAYIACDDAYSVAREARIAARAAYDAAAAAANAAARDYVAGFGAAYAAAAAAAAPYFAGYVVGDAHVATEEVA